MSDTAVSFKERVAETVSQYAHHFKSVFVDYEYLVCSNAFIQNPYYIVSAVEDNYMHLTGIPFRDPQLFFTHCINGTFTEADVSFSKRGQSEQAVKGSIRRKIKVLPDLMRIFSIPIMAEESFQKNRVTCSFGTSDGAYTIGFTLTNGIDLKVRPMTLLSGNELDLSKTSPVDLVLKRAVGKTLFDTIIFGDNAALCQYKSVITTLISEDLKLLISEQS